MILRTKDIKHSYDSLHVFQFPDINCNAGESLLLMGPSGSGKTSLLHIMAGLMKPSQGKVFINDCDIHSLVESKRDNFRAKNIGIALQKPIFIASLNVIENLLLFQKLARIKVSKSDCEQLLDLVNMKHKKASQVNALSQGELQRLMFIRSLIHKPKILFVDEPTSSLDDAHAIIIAKLLKEQTEKYQTSLVIVSHDIRLKTIFEHQIQLT
ncbi:MAG: ATP-binding cassette domain-containing protein [Bacteroidota bacterium]|nr:ATP-binding cassette domain-containing protein [Bacteroidota bacterium]